MNVAAYLQRIGCERRAPADVETLRTIHTAHLRSVPFENLDIAIGRPIRLDLGAIYAKIVDRRRGGFCYELNGLLGSLLTELGYEVTLLSASSFNHDRTTSPEYDHLVMLVACPGSATRWLADVGWGSGFERPLCLDDRLIQDQGSRFWRLDSDDEYYSLWERAEDGKWIPHYRFTLRPRDYQEFAGMCAYHQNSPDSIFTQKRICTLFTADGRATLSDSKLIVTHDGEKEERELPADEIAAVLRDYFGIVL